LQAISAQSAAKAQKVAQESLAQVVAAKQADDVAAQEADQLTMEAESSALVSCNATWDKNHPEVFTELEQCEQVKLDIDAAEAQVAALSSNVQAAQATAATALTSGVPHVAGPEITSANCDGAWLYVAVPSCKLHPPSGQ